MDILDPLKLEVIRRKSQVLNEELRNLEMNKEEFQQLGHDKDNVTYFLKIKISNDRLMNYLIMQVKLKKQ